MSVLSLVGGAQAYSSASGGKVYALNTLGAVTPLQIVPANTSRRKLTIHNPGVVDVFVAPAISATGAAITISLAALGGSFRVFANGGTLVIDGECQTAWNALAASGVNNGLTAMDSNI
jgi:hypothetical protein